MPPITIIEADLAQPAHQDAIVRLINAYARDPMGNGQDLSEQVCAALIPGLQQHPTTLVFLAWHGEEAVGIAVCFVGFSTFAARPLINIHDLAIMPAYRQQGVGRLLLERVEAKGRELGCCKLTLEVRADNHPAQRLYQHVGFQHMEYGDEAMRVWFLQKWL
jgi:ribosomal protein S18 acetylase RimI-like enzyme